MKNRKIQVIDLGVIDYKTCWDYQEELFSGIIAQKISNRDKPESEQTPTPNYLLFAEHPHVYTLGKSGNEKNLLLTDEQIRLKNASYYRINRGGDITYHGPGQMVVYPILDLDNFFTDIHKYLRLLEETIILTMKEYGLNGVRSTGETGVWLEPSGTKGLRKICALGVRCSRWVTMHGLALNVNADLGYFDNIIPCGIKDKGVTSLKEETCAEIPMERIKTQFVDIFSQMFNAKLITNATSVR